MNHRATQNRLLMSLGLLGAVACSTPSRSQTAGAEQAVDSSGVGATRAALVKAILAGDSVGYVSYYTESATVVAAGIPTVIGRKDIRTVVGGLFAGSKTSSFEVHPLVVVGKGGMLSEIGWQHDIGVESGKPPQESWGRYALIWVRGADGAWRIETDVLISDSVKAVKGS